MSSCCGRAGLAARASAHFLLRHVGHLVHPGDQPEHRIGGLVHLLSQGARQLECGAAFLVRFGARDGDQADDLEEGKRYAQQKGTALVRLRACLFPIRLQLLQQQGTARSRLHGLRPHQRAHLLKGAVQETQEEGGIQR